MRVQGATLIVAAALIGNSTGLRADSEGPDFTSVMRHAYRMEERNDAERRQWQRDIQRRGLNAELNRERMSGAGYGSARLVRMLMQCFLGRRRAMRMNGSRKW